MALPPTALSHLGFEARVTCDGQPLPVYSVEVVGNKATCWIPSEAGKAFEVEIKLIDESLRMNLAARLVADGDQIAGNVLRNLPPISSRVITFRGRYSSATTLQRLYFSSLTMSDDDAAVKDGALLSSLGTLNIKVNRVTITGGSAPLRTVHAAGKLVERNLTVHERAKKLGGHRTTLGGDETVPATNQVNVKDHELHVEFEFRYRPKEVLQAQDIIPVPRTQLAKRPLDPTGLHDSTNVPHAKKIKTKGSQPTSGVAKKPKPEPVDEDDVEVMRARIRELEAKLRKRGGSASDDDAPVKVEPEPINGRVFAKGEVIDLTDD